MFWCRMVLAALGWLVYEAFFIPCWIAGFLVVPFAIAKRTSQRSPIFPDRTIVNAPSYLWLWGNDEDGYSPPWFAARTPNLPPILRMYLWAAWRNPVNNARFIKWAHPPQRAEKVQWLVRGNFTLIWQGLLYRLIWTNSKRWFSIGWKYSAEKKDAQRWQAHGQGFGIRFKRDIT